MFLGAELSRDGLAIPNPKQINSQLDYCQLFTLTIIFSLQQEALQTPPHAPLSATLYILVILASYLPIQSLYYKSHIVPYWAT